MKILIEAPFDLNEGQKSDIEDKIKQLAIYNSKITQAMVFFKLDDGNIPDSVTAEVQLHVPGPVIFGAEVKNDYWEAFTGAYNKVKRQVRKKKEIRKDPYSDIRPI